MFIVNSFENWLYNSTSDVTALSDFLLPFEIMTKMRRDKTHINSIVIHPASPL